MKNFNLKKITFRLALSVFIIFLLISGCINTSNIEKRELKLWYEQPASDWNEALPVGNGRLGAMVFGGTQTEQIQLNEESLWAGSKLNNNNPKALQSLGKIRELLLNDKLKEARELAGQTLLGTPPRIHSYQTMGDIYLEFGEREVENYKRELNLNEGVCKTSYSSAGVNFEEEVLASAPDNIIAVSLKASKKGALNLTIGLERVQDAVVSARQNMLIMEGQIMDEDDPQRGPGGAHMRFASYLKAINKGGELTTLDNKLKISNADELVLIYTAATDYNLEKLNFDRSIEPSEICDNILSQIKSEKYDDIKSTHLKDYQPIFNRVELDLGGQELDSIPTDKRLAMVKEGTNDPGLVSLYFQYGRYLLMGSSRSPGILPANLQGVWCKDITAPWNSDFHTNINLQMNYWPAELCNLSETSIPLVNLMEQIQKTGSATAKEMYGCRGWTMHHLTNAFGRTGLMDGVEWGTFPMGGPWMTFPVYRHYEFTRDLEYLNNRAYPIMKGSAQFILDYLVEDNNGNLVTAPSNSPENSFLIPGSSQTFKMTYGSTIDIQIITELFNNCMEASKALGIDKEFADSLKTVLTKLPPLKVSERTGGVQEWIKDYKEADPGHRHISHLLGLYPGTQINSSTPELFDAAKKTITRRLSSGGGHTGWSRAWIINFYARLKDSEQASHHLTELFRKSTLPNLFDNHPPFQIDGNFGGTAGIAEMLLQSHSGLIELLPALPSHWAKGNVIGLKARGDYEVDITWNNGQLEQALIKSKKANKIKLVYMGEVYSLDIQEGENLFKP